MQNFLDADLRYREVYHFARTAHQGQVRKYTGEPYITHPLSVAHTVSLVRHSPEMVIAALLHDVVEDCGVSLQTIDDNWGWTVRTYVDELTKRDHFHPEWNRIRRKAYEAGRLTAALPQVQTIKLADLIDNTRTILLDPAFARVYLEEKRFLVTECLTRGDPLLLKFAREQVETGLAILNAKPKLEIAA